MQTNYKLKYLYFYLTDGCNLNCRHCYINPKFILKDSNIKFLDLEIFKKIIKEAKPLGLIGVKLSGGEPLLHPKIEKIFDIIKKENLKLVLETNATLITKSLAKKIKSINSFVAVSLDGKDTYTYEWIRGVAGSFSRFKKGFNNLISEGIRPQVIITLMRINKDILFDIIKFVKYIKAGSIKINPMQPIMRAESLYKDNQNLSIEELIKIGNYIENFLSKEIDIPIFFHQPIVFRPLSKIFFKEGYNCGTCKILNILGVIPDGSYGLCGISEFVPKLNFGLAQENSIIDIWNENPILKEIRTGLPNKLDGVCKICIFKSLCLGACLAYNYYLTKNLWSGFWYCQEAKKIGLFPLNRTIFKRGL